MTTKGEDYLKSLQLLIDHGKKDIPDFKENDISDGYHTFNELYEFRKLYHALLFNEWSKKGLYDVHKSIKHNDGEDAFGGGWFIVVATLPSGQVSNHYKIKDWDLFQCEDTQKAKHPFDGHTPKDVLARLSDLFNSLPQTRGGN